MIDTGLPGATVLTVGELTSFLKALLLASPLQDVWVRGEVSNTSLSRAGHLFFSLKDEYALLKCVAFTPASHRVKRDVVDGQEVIAHGRLDLYPAQGVYQLYVEGVITVGIGLAYVEFERVKRMLEQEGLFGLERKRPLPEYPVRVGVVTSAYGAALRDIQNVLSRRWPAAELVLGHASVQGDGAPAEVVAAIASVCASGVDVLIVARGGGAKEDLSCFNDERVARAIAAAPVPVVTGIGHETDFSIADFVADLRAPTPSAAAEAAVPDRIEVGAGVAQWRRRLMSAQAHDLGARRTALTHTDRSLWRASPQYQLTMTGLTLDDLVARMRRDQEKRITARREAVAGLTARLRLATPSFAPHRAALTAARTALATSGAERLRLARADLRTLESRLASLDPTATLQRGYAIVRRRDLFRGVVTRAHGLTRGEELVVQFADGAILTEVTRAAKPNRSQEGSEAR